MDKRVLSQCNPLHVDKSLSSVKGDGLPHCIECACHFLSLCISLTIPVPLRRCELHGRRLPHTRWQPLRTPTSLESRSLTDLPRWPLALSDAMRKAPAP